MRLTEENTRPLRIDVKAGRCMEDIIESYRQLCERLAYLDLPATAADYARHGRALAHRFYTKGQMGYYKFDKYLQ